MTDSASPGVAPIPASAAGSGSAGGDSPVPAAPPVPSVTAVELGIARILVIGTRLAVAVMAVGVVLLFASGRSPLESSWPRLDIVRLPADLLALRPEAFLWSGLLVVLATPLVRVGASTIGFAITHERRMVALGVTVLAVLALAVLSGLAAGG